MVKNAIVSDDWLWGDKLAGFDQTFRAKPRGLDILTRGDGVFDYQKHQWVTPLLEHPSKMAVCHQNASEVGPSIWSSSD